MAGCGDVLSLEDLQTAKKHQIFEAEVITGKAGGVAGGAAIDYATNQVTGQVQKTLPAILRDTGFRPAPFTFATGGTLALGDSDMAVLWPVSSGGDGQYYIWKGVYPKVIPAASSPATTGGVSDSGWMPLGDITLRSDLASSTPGKGVDLVFGAAKQSDVDELKSNERKNVDTIADLRLLTPSGIGEVVYVCASIAPPIGTQGYFGGGHFVAYDNTAANTDDGGVFINSPHATLDWQRINFTEYDMRFWGMIPNLASFDNAPAITLATNFAKTNKVMLHAPVGDIYTSEMVPIYSNMGITGHGSAEQTIFYKTTNNAFPYKDNLGNTVFTMDALVGFVPKKSIAGGSVIDGETHTARAILSQCMFRRAGLTEANYNSTRPAVGLFLGSAAGGRVSDVVVEGGYIGCQGWTCYLISLERVNFPNYRGKGFTGVAFSAYYSPPVGYKTAGTTLDMRLVGCSGYQIGFEMVGQQYSSMICCSCENIEPMAGEVYAVAFRFINPYCITMNSCATEGVSGAQFYVTNAGDVSYKSSLVVQNYLAIDQRNPFAPTTQFIFIDNGGVGTLNVTFIGGDLTRNTLQPNLSAGTVNGAGAKAIKIGAGGLVLTPLAGGGFTDLA